MVPIEGVKLRGCDLHCMNVSTCVFVDEKVGIVSINAGGFFRSVCIFNEHNLGCRTKNSFIVVL